MKAEKQKLTKIYYSMGEVAEMFDVNTTLIRFWESKFDVLKPHRNKKGNRLFTPEDVETLKLIYHLVKEKGMTLAGAQKRIKENREGIERNMDIIEKLQNIKAVLLEIKQEMKGGDTDGTILVGEDMDYDGAAVPDPAGETSEMAVAVETFDVDAAPEPTIDTQFEEMNAAVDKEMHGTDTGNVLLDEGENAASEEAFHIEAVPEPTVDTQFEEMSAAVSVDGERPEHSFGGIAAGDTATAGTASCVLPAEAAEKDDAAVQENGEVEIEVQRPKIVEQTLF